MSIDIWGGWLGAVYLGDTLIAGWGWGGWGNFGNWLQYTNIRYGYDSWYSCYVPIINMDRDWCIISFWRSRISASQWYDCYYWDFLTKLPNEDFNLCWLWFYSRCSWAWRFIIYWNDTNKDDYKMYVSCSCLYSDWYKCCYLSYCINLAGPSFCCFGSWKVCCTQLPSPGSWYTLLTDNWQANDTSALINTFAWWCTLATKCMCCWMCWWTFWWTQYYN